MDRYGGAVHTDFDVEEPTKVEETESLVDTLERLRTDEQRPAINEGRSSMTTASAVEVLRAHLAKEGLVLCKFNDTQFPLDGLKETEALVEIVNLVEDTTNIKEWDEGQNTTPVPQAVMAALARAS